jgi:hypothetical protein
MKNIIEVDSINHRLAYDIDVERGQSIRIRSTEDEYINGNVRPVTHDVTFKIGDLAIYDCYNFDYTGHIVSITEKTVTILKEHSSRKARMELVDFAFYNRDFDLDAIRKNNERVFYTV